MSPLLGGEFVVAFLAARIALWIWRSRAELRSFFGDEPPGPKGGLPLPAPRPRLRLVPQAPAAEPASTLSRAA